MSKREVSILEKSNLTLEEAAADISSEMSKRPKKYGII